LAHKPVILSEAEGSPEQKNWGLSHCQRHEIPPLRSGWQCRFGTQACHPERSRRISWTEKLRS